MNKLCLSISTVICGCIQLGSLGQSEDSPADALNHPQPLRLEVTAGAWLPRLGADVTQGPNPAATELELGEELQLDDLESSPNVELSIGRGNWDVLLSSYGFSTDASATLRHNTRFGDVFAPAGATIRSDFDIFSIGAEISYALGSKDGWYSKSADFADPLGHLIRTGEPSIGLRVAPLIGARYLDVDQEFHVLGGNSLDTGGEWVGVYGGVNLDIQWRPRELLPLLHRLEINTSFAGGPVLGGEGGTVGQIRATLTAYPTPQLGLSFGYRLLEMNVESSDDYEFSGGLQGLFVGATFRF